jgi:hypothetical protein
MLVDVLAAGGASVVAGPPPKDTAPAAVAVTLVDVTLDPAARFADRHDHLMRASYVLSVTGADGGDTDLLAGVVRAVLSEPRAQIDPTPVPLQMWIAHGVAPRPAIAVHVPVTVAIDIERAPRVTEPLVLQPVDLRHHRPSEPPTTVAPTDPLTEGAR